MRSNTPTTSTAANVSYQAAMEIFDDGPIKPVRIWSRIGQRPIIAGGNSNGDIPMLRYAGGKDRPALRLLVNHDDAEREFAYTGGAEKSLEYAAEHDWTVVSMKATGRPCSPASSPDPGRRSRPRPRLTVRGQPRLG